MSDNKKNLINEEELNKVTGGTANNEPKITEYHVPESFNSNNWIFYNPDNDTKNNSTENK